MDKSYSLVWGSGQSRPYVRCRKQEKNMQDLKNEMKIKIIWWKIQKGVLERIGHILRMPDTRQTKIAVLGWFKGLEGEKITSGRKKKTHIYWYRILREAGKRWSEAGTIRQDRDRWRDMIEKRTEHLSLWERSRSNLVKEDRSLARNWVMPVWCMWEDLQKQGRPGHLQKEDARRVAPAPQLQMPPVKWKLSKREYNDEPGESMWWPMDGGAGSAVREDHRQNIAKHVRACTANEAEGGMKRNVRPEDGPARVCRPNEIACPNSGRTLSATNMARHLKRYAGCCNGEVRACVYGRVAPIKSSLSIASIA